MHATTEGLLGGCSFLYSARSLLQLNYFVREASLHNPQGLGDKFVTLAEVVSALTVAIRREEIYRYVLTIVMKYGFLS
jgi:hypothetical protein